MRNKYFWVAIFWTLLITIACLISADNFDELNKIEMPAKDKFLHATFYFVFTVLWYLGFSRSKRIGSRKSRLLSFAFAVGYGIVLEICQGLFTKERTPDVIDALANTAGSTIAVFGLWLYHRRKNTNNNSPAY